MFTDEAIAAVLGAAALGNDRHRNLERLATAIAEAHWHLSGLPWEELPLFPLPVNAKAKRLKAFVEFGKRAIRTQLAAEDVAVAVARHLLVRAEDERMHLSVRRALAAVVNDEASHLLVMTEMYARAETQFPEFPLDEPLSPLWQLFRDAIPPLHPALLALFMGTYEAMIGIRSYAEQTAYGRPSILGMMASHAIEDDGRHAKVMRLAAHEWFHSLRKQVADRVEEQMREIILDPIRRIWPLLIHQEYWLLQNDARQRNTLYRRVDEDAALANHLMSLLGLSAGELAYTDLEGIGLAEARAMIGEKADG